MSTTTPAGWYPDPKPADPTNPGQRWWNGTEWTVSTKTDEPLSVETDVPKQRSRPRRATVVAGTVAALLGLGIGSLTTYLIMDGSDNGTTKAAVSTPGNGGGNGGLFGEGGSGGSSGGSGSTGGSGNLPGGSTGGSTGGDGSTGGSGGTSTSSTTAYDIVDGISLPIPSGWTGGTTTDGFASMYVGSYTCAGSTSGSSSTCSLGGANTETLKASVSAGAKAAAEADIATAAKEAYNDLNSHTVLESQAVTVAGRSGYLIRWKVDAKVGNDGTVETVVFPTSDNKSLVALHMGFDTAAKAPDVSVMDTIVSGIKDATVSGASGGTSGTTGSNS